MTNLRLAQVAAILSVLAPLGGNAQTDPTLLRFIHPDAKALVSIDWKRVRQSHLGTMIREKWVDQNAGGAIPGIEFLDDLDRVLISSPGRNPADPTADAPLLIVASGRFDLEKVRNVLATNGAKPQMFNNTQVYRPQGKSGKDMAFVLLDAQTILIGDARSVFASLERTAFPVTPAANPANPLLARAAQLDANFDIWAVMSTPGALASDRLMGMFTGQDLAADARAFEIAFSLRSGLTIESAVMFQAESSAKHMASELSRLLKLTMKDKMGEPAVLDLEKKLKITSEGPQVKIAVHMTQQELEKNAQIFTASHSKPQAAAVADVRQSDAAVNGVRPLTLPPADPPKPEKKVIRIEGLDEGTREIPYRERQ